MVGGEKETRGVGNKERAKGGVQVWGKLTFVLLG